MLRLSGQYPVISGDIVRLLVGINYTIPQGGGVPVLVWIQHGNTMIYKFSAILVVIMFIVCFTIAGIADNTVNEDWNRLHNPAVPVTIETHYIINGNEYIVAVDDVNAIVTWVGDIPTIDIIK